MKRTASITLGTVLLGLAAACSSGDPDHSGICVDPATELRVEDDRCDQAGSRVVWFYYPATYSAPPVGQRINVQHGTYVKPAGSVGRVPATGGFGSTKGSGAS